MTLISGLRIVLGHIIHPQLSRSAAQNVNKTQNRKTDYYEYNEGDENFIHIHSSGESNSAQFISHIYHLYGIIKISRLAGLTTVCYHINKYNRIKQFSLHFGNIAYSFSILFI